jgi:hypothetical protein
MDVAGSSPDAAPEGAVVEEACALRDATEEAFAQLEVAGDIKRKSGMVCLTQKARNELFG